MRRLSWLLSAMCVCVTMGVGVALLLPACSSSSVPLRSVPARGASPATAAAAPGEWNAVGQLQDSRGLGSTALDSTSASANGKVPLLGDIPPIGQLFRNSAQRAALADPSCLPSRNEELWIIQRPGEAQRAARLAVNDDSVPGCGSLVTSVRDEAAGTETQVPVPLKHTDVRAAIDGYIASVTVTQQFHNPFSGKIEAVYVFPLPENAAVNDFMMTVGDRKIRGIIREREEAQKIYNEARSQGYVASLLTEERPNIFTQKVANIEPGKSIDIAIKYFNTLSYIDGSYEFVFPMVVGPRFNPPANVADMTMSAIHGNDAQARGTEGQRHSPSVANLPTGRTPDGIGAAPRGAYNSTGQKTEVQYLRPGERSGHDIAVAVSIGAGGTPVDDVICKSHVIQTRRDGSRVEVVLNSLDSIPNKDFVLRYKLGGADTGGVRSAAIMQTSSRGSYVSLMLVPPEELKGLRRHPLELVFVLDCSGSMNGEPISQAKAAIERALRQLEPNDTFQLIRFSNNADTLGPAPILATRENIRRGLAYLKSLDSEGGTMMIEGVKAALDFPHDPSRLRFVCFLTDGYIGNDVEILAEVQRRLGPTRIFSFGVGSSVNRFLMDSMARVGRGCAAYIATGDSSTDIMDAFISRISHPAMTDVSIDWNGLAVETRDVFPQQLPDLFVGRPVIVSGRVNGGMPSGGEARAIRVTANIGGERRTITVPVSIDTQTDDSPRALAAVWARHKIADLAESATASNAENAVSSIRQVALEYGLMSRYTAFVAVDSMTRTEGSFGTSVTVPVNMPEGVKYETTVPESR